MLPTNIKKRKLKTEKDYEEQYYKRGCTIMKAGEILISGIFNGSRLLEVPFYQRAYVWQEEQWERLLEDLKYVSNTRKQYFMGSIILRKH